MLSPIFMEMKMQRLCRVMSCLSISYLKSHQKEILDIIDGDLTTESESRTKKVRE